jgi:hypothetical protein
MQQVPVFNTRNTAGLQHELIMAVLLKMLPKAEYPPST